MEGFSTVPDCKYSDKNEQSNSNINNMKKKNNKSKTKSQLNPFCRFSVSIILNIWVVSMATVFPALAFFIIY